MKVSFMSFISSISAKIFVGIISLFLVTASSLYSQDGNGGYAGSFLQIPIGARPTALGGAYTAISNDGSGPLFNPAGIATIQNKLFSSSYRTMQLDRSLGYLTLLFPAQSQAVIGINWLYAGSGSVDERNIDGDNLGRSVTFNNHDIAVVFAKRFEDYLSFGARLSYLQASLEDMQTALVSFDLGFIVYMDGFVSREERYLKSIQDLKIGFVVKNLGAKYRWDGSELSNTTSSTIQEDDVPIEFRLGVSGRIMDKKLLFSSDISKNTKQDVRLHFGLEYTHLQKLALRTGLDGKRLAAGFGYLFNLGNHTLALDYAFSADKVGEGSEHIFSFDILF